MTDHVPPTAVSPQEDAAPPVDLNAVKLRWIHGYIESTSDIDAFRAAARDVSTLVAEIERLKALLAVPEGRLRELVEKWRERAKDVVNSRPAEFHYRAHALIRCADELETLLASLSPPSEGQ